MGVYIYMCDDRLYASTHSTQLDADPVIIVYPWATRTQKPGVSHVSGGSQTDNRSIFLCLGRLASG